MLLPPVREMSGARIGTNGLIFVRSRVSIGRDHYCPNLAPEQLMQPASLSHKPDTRQRAAEGPVLCNFVCFAETRCRERRHTTGNCNLVKRHLLLARLMLGKRAQLEPRLFVAAKLVLCLNNLLRKIKRASRMAGGTLTADSRPANDGRVVLCMQARCGDRI